MSEVCELCNGKKHVKVDGKWRRCECLKQEIRDQRSSSMGQVEPIEDSALLEQLTSTIRIEAPISLVKKHLAGVVQQNPQLSVLARSVHPLLEDHLDDTKSSARFNSVDLLVVVLDGAYANRFIPRLLNGVVTTRRLKEKGTWLVMDFWDTSALLKRFDPDGQYDNSELERLLNDLEEVKLA